MPPNPRLFSALIFVPRIKKKTKQTSNPPKKTDPTVVCIMAEEGLAGNHFEKQREDVRSTKSVEEQSSHQKERNKLYSRSHSEGHI